MNALRGLRMPPAGWTLTGLLAFYVLAGLVGHDPWKTEDATHLGVAWDILSKHTWAELSLAGRPWHEAPLYYWTAGLCGKLASGLLPAHDAMRLASGVWLALSLVGVYYTSRELHGQDSAAAGPLLLAGSVGLMEPGHMAQPMLTALCAHATALGALAACGRKPHTAMPLLGLAWAVCLLGAGLAATLPLLALAPLAFLYREPPFRTARSLLQALVLAGLLALLVWQGLDPVWREAWWQREWQRLGHNAHPGTTLLGLLNLLASFAWPALPIAGWTLWSRRRRLHDEPALLLPLGQLLLALAMLASCYPAREIPALLLLPPLVQLAVPGALSLRRGAAQALDWFSKMTFSFFLILVWVGWSALVLGWPQRLAQRTVILEPGFVGQFQTGMFALALAVSLGWFYLIFSSPRSPYRGLTHWTAGFSTFWLLLATLWLQWVDYGKSYRQLALQVQQQLPAAHGCVQESGLSNPHRASLAYFSGIETRPARQGQCDWMLRYNSGQSRPATAEIEGWELVWEGNRPGDRQEKFRLYHRAATAEAQRIDAR